jgi:hypothetical protein
VDFPGFDESFYETTASIHLDGPFPHHREAWQALLKAAGWPETTSADFFTRVEETPDFESGTHTHHDQPLSFGTNDSSGIDGL